MQQTAQIGALPAEFRELENLVQGWSLATEHERRERRADHNSGGAPLPGFMESQFGPN